LRGAAGAALCLTCLIAACGVPVDATQLGAATNPTASHATPTPPAPDCLAGNSFETVQIQRVTDGDTVVLDDARRVRIIGINTPELRPHAERFAKQARKSLISFIQHDTQVQLFTGVETHDRHGRTLAYLRRQDGRDVGQHLLNQGLAAYSAVAPNTRCARWYKSLEDTARQARIGLWQQPHAWQLNGPSLGRDDTGFHIVTGVVQEIRRHGSQQRIELDNGLRIHVNKTLAKQIDQAALIGSQVEVRGWLRRDGKQLLVNLHHPVNLHIKRKAKHVVSD